MNVFYSEIYNPQGNLVSSGRQDNSVKLMKAEDFGTWRFIYLNKMFMVPIEIKYQINMIGE